MPGEKAVSLALGSAMLPFYREVWFRDSLLKQVPENAFVFECPFFLFSDQKERMTQWICLLQGNMWSLLPFPVVIQMHLFKASSQVDASIFSSPESPVPACPVTQRLCFPHQNQAVTRRVFLEHHPTWDHQKSRPSALCHASSWGPQEPWLIKGDMNLATFSSEQVRSSERWAEGMRQPRDSGQ